MKKSVFVNVLAGLIICLTAPALTAQQKAYVGFRAGGGIANQYWDYKALQVLLPDSWQKPITGLHAVLFLEKPLNKYIVLRPEVGYYRKGATPDLTFTDENGNAISPNSRGDKDAVALTFLTAALLGRVYILPEARLRPYMLAGVRAEYLQYIRGVRYTYPDGTNSVLFGNRDFYNQPFSYGGVVGAGVSFRNDMFIEAEYNPSLSPVGDTPTLRIHNRYVGVSVGMHLRRPSKS